MRTYNFPVRQMLHTLHCQIEDTCLQKTHVFYYFFGNNLRHVLLIWTMSFINFLKKIAPCLLFGPCLLFNFFGPKLLDFSCSNVDINNYIGINYKCGASCNFWLNWIELNKMFLKKLLLRMVCLAPAPKIHKIFF